jgi:hypothetical protein
MLVLDQVHITLPRQVKPMTRPASQSGRSRSQAIAANRTEKLLNHLRMHNPKIYLIETISRLSAPSLA